MAAKQLISYELPATTNTVIGTVPADKEWSFTIVFCNRTDADIKVRFAVSTSGTSNPDVSEYYMYDVIVPANNSIERSGHTAQASRKIICYASAVGLSINAHGYEE